MGAAEISQLVSSISAYGDVMSERGLHLQAAGAGRGGGLDRGLDAPLAVGGDAVSKGRTGIVARAEVASTGGRLVDTGTVQLLLRGPNTAGAMAAPEDGEGGGGPGGEVLAVYGFNLPSTVGERPSTRPG